MGQRASKHVDCDKGAEDVVEESSDDEQRAECKSCGTAKPALWCRRASAQFFAEKVLSLNKVAYAQTQRGDVNGEGAASAVEDVDCSDWCVVERKKRICVNCKETTTTIWRRNSAAELVCNACAMHERLRVYRKLHERKRPVGTERRKSDVDEGTCCVRAQNSS